MSFEVTEKLPLRDLFGQVGSLPVPLKRFQNVAALRLLLGVPFLILPTQIFLRGALEGGWNPDAGLWVVDMHLAAMLFYVPCNLLLWRSARPQMKDNAWPRSVSNWLCVACEILTNQAFMISFGTANNFCVAYLVLFVALYRLLFGYWTAVGIAVAATGSYLFFAALEFYAVIPTAPLLLHAVEHPLREAPELWSTVMISVLVIVVFAFLIANYAMNQTARLHTYVTRSVLQRYLPPELVDRAAEGELRLDAPPERRVVTVMFTDVVGFTALSERLGPEAVGALLSRFLGEVATLAMAHGATVDKFIGDCVMVVFGAPVACTPEEQARRCVKLAQAIHARVAEMGSEFELHARTGLNTGEAVVGNFGSEARSDYTVLGHAVNVAARLESASRPDRILIGSETARLLGGSLPLESAGALQLKGVSEPVEAWFVA